MGGAGALVLVGHLAREDQVKLSRRHTRPRKDAGALQSGGCGDQQRRVTFPVDVFLKQKRHIEKQDITAGMGQKPGAIFRNKRMDQLFQLFQARRIGRQQRL